MKTQRAGFGKRISERLVKHSARMLELISQGWNRAQASKQAYEEIVHGITECKLPDSTQALINAVGEEEAVEVLTQGPGTCSGFSEQLQDQLSKVF